MTEWLTDTLLMTGAFMVLVLLLRRPVGRWFGPGAAYALWALPMIRLVLPPLALPRGLLPDYGIALERITASASAPVDAVMTMNSAEMSHAVLTDAAPVYAADPDFFAQVPWGTLLLAAWLSGAVLFLAWRAASYRAMRRELLDGARVMATAGDIRIIESPATPAPLAFGVFDKVIALPMGFLAETDSEASDLAIAHELEHHAGSDLLALMAMQPLFALHWFNPIGWAAWRAVRSDQEAACDARVMGGRGGEERALYGRLIASFAGGRRLALIAPMAGPLSGEKPIIHRLKALSRSDVGPARRVLGRSLFAASIMAVPVTATFSYAATEEQTGLETVYAPAVPTVPVAPSVPADSDAAFDRSSAVAQGGVPDAPAAAQPPVPPFPPESLEAAAIPAPPEPPMPPMPPMPPVPPAPPSPGTWTTIETSAARARAAKRIEAGARGMSDHAQRLAAAAIARAPQVEETITADGKGHTIRLFRTDEDHRREVMQETILDGTCRADRRHQARAAHNRSNAAVVVCTGMPKVAMMATVNALRSARASIASDRHLDGQVRAEVLADLDGEIEDALREARQNYD